MSQGNVPPPQYPAQYQQPKKSHTLRNVLLVFLGIFILGFGACAVVVGTAANEVGKSIDKAVAKDSKPGGPDNPMEIKEGKAFEVQGFKYDAGWKLKKKDMLDSFAVKGLKVTNLRGEKDSALVEIKLMKGNEVVALADCTTDPIQPDNKVKVQCISTDPLPKKYDTITINDTF